MALFDLFLFCGEFMILMFFFTFVFFFFNLRLDLYIFFTKSRYIFLSFPVINYVLCTLFTFNLFIITKFSSLLKLIPRNKGNLVLRRYIIFVGTFFFFVNLNNRYDFAEDHLIKKITFALKISK